MDQADGVASASAPQAIVKIPHDSACRLRAVDGDDLLQGRAVESSIAYRRCRRRFSVVEDG